MILIGFFMPIFYQTCPQPANWDLTMMEIGLKLEITADMFFNLSKGGEKMDKRALFLGCLFLFLIAGCAGKNCTENFDPLSADSEDEEVCEIFDPLEPLNRVIYSFNDFIYQIILDPIDKVYMKLPEFFRRSVRNILHNAESPVFFVGSLMHGDRDAARIAGECLINTLPGLGGIIDWVDYQYPDEEDIGQGLATWGVGEGFYIVLPIIGPRTLRDAIGDAGAFALGPTSQMDVAGSMSYTSIETIDIWNECSESYSSITDQAIDPYSALKRSYVDNRRDRISR